MDVDGGDAPAGASSKVKTEMGQEGGAVGAGSRTAAGESAPAGRRVKEETSSAAGKQGKGHDGHRKKIAGGGAEKGGGDSGIVLATAALLIRHAMQDTFGKAAVTVVSNKKTAAAAAADKKGSSDKTPLSSEIKIDTDGAVARLRVFVVPPPLAPAQRLRPDAAAMGDGGNGAGGSAEGEAAWRCEVVECTRDSLKSQIRLLVERLRVAVSKS